MIVKISGDTRQQFQQMSLTILANRGFEVLREILSSMLVGKEAARWRAPQVAQVAPSRPVGAHQSCASLVVIYNFKSCQQEMHPQHH